VNLNFVLSNINYKVILIVVFSCIIGYLLNSLLSGVVGACCDNMEDYSQLKIVTILPVFLGFNITMLSLNFYNANFIYFTSLFPFVSMFSAPINFICGKISLILLLISWVIQLICIYILFSFSAKVYQGILFYKGNKINLKQLILISKYERGYCNRENRNSSTVD
jgi:ABC-2 type transport system permease protein